MEENKPNSLIREFWLSTLSVNNRTSVFVIIFLITVLGLLAYTTMPRENFPEIKIPTVYVGTAYPGNSPLDMESLVTRPIEKEINSITGVKSVSSNSIQDFSSVIVEFDFSIDVDKALQDVKDAVDRAQSELPNDLPADPNVLKIDFGDLPVMNINISGIDDMNALKHYAEYLQDEIEKLPEISSADIAGLQEQEVVIKVDANKLAARKMSLYDIEGAVGAENLTVSGGDILQGGVRRNIRIVGEFESVEELENVIVKSEFGNIVYLKDVAEVDFQYEETSSYSRWNTAPVVSISVIKRTGTNLINASMKIKEILANANANIFPDDLKVELINDTSKITQTMVKDLENSIISGVILVVLVLLFFLGLRNSLFVGIAIPLSMLMGFVFLQFLGATLNTVILFSLILALGMLVDNGIVVVENIYRLRQEGLSPERASKEGAGEVALPIIASTATTLAAFLPLLFWDSIMGEFMGNLPFTLIIVLSSSLFVALVINPALTSVLMKVEDPSVKTKYGRVLLSALVCGILAAGCYSVGFGQDNGTMRMLGSVFAISAGLILIQTFIFKPLSHIFLEKVMPLLERLYEKILRGVLFRWWSSALIVLGTVGLLIFSVVLLGSSGMKIDLFPLSEPNQVYVYTEYPVGTDIQKTNELTEKLEKIVLETLEPYQEGIEAVLANVGEGAGDPMESFNTTATPNKSRISVIFYAFNERKGISSRKAMNELDEALKDFPGASIRVAQDENGPPAGADVNLEITGDDFETLIALSEDVKSYLENSGVPGIDELKTDTDANTPEMRLNIDRDKARRYGLSTGMIAGDIRTAVFGKEISTYKDGEEEYPINLRFDDEMRYDVGKLMDFKVTFRNQSNGRIVQVPVSAVADRKNTSTIGSVQRLDQARVVSLSANAKSGYNGGEIVTEYRSLMEGYEMPNGYSYKFTGQQEEQDESTAFLIKALFIAVGLIFLIIVAQFNSVWVPFIILASVVFSTIGVFLGYSIFRMDFIIIMTGIGIISLAGIVVNNAIVLIDYTNLVRRRMKGELGLDDGESRMSASQVKDAIVQGGSVRLRPVLLTAITTVLGLIPLAIGFNIDFAGLLRDFDPNIFVGGENTVFWGPMAWTIIFGLVFATFLTLVVVPAMYYLTDRSLSKVFGQGLNTR